MTLPWLAGWLVYALRVSGLADHPSFHGPDMDCTPGNITAGEASGANALDIRRQGRGYRLAASMFLPHSIGKVFEFFADAGNLNAITPAWLQFRILTPLPVVMGQGLLLNYSLLFRGIPMRWQSEITVWEPPNRFVDEQRKGPYRKWVHEHIFREEDTGTEVSDRVNYEVPGGKLVHRLLVKKNVTEIFRYRQRRLREIFHGNRD